MAGETRSVLLIFTKTVDEVNAQHVKAETGSDKLKINRGKPMIKGLIAPVLTPFDDELNLDQGMYNDFAAQLLETGCSGLAPFGTTGEATSVSNSERSKALEGLVTSGIDPKVIIPGVGLCNLPETVTLSRHAQELGCAGTLVLPPFYFKGTSDEGLFDYYRMLIEKINDPKLKIYLYHIPQVSGVPLTIELVSRLKLAYPEIIAGIKDSSGDWQNTKALLEINGLVVYPGAELSVIDAIRLGAPGCISATANLNPVDIGKVISLCHEGKWEDAESLHENIKKVRLLFQDYAPIPAQKALLAMRTGNRNWNNLRPPLKPLPPEKASELVRVLKEDFNFQF